MADVAEGLLVSVLERALGPWTGGMGTGQELPLDRPPWIRQPRLLGVQSVRTPEGAMAISAVLSCVKQVSLTTGDIPLIAYQQRRSGDKERARDTDLWTLVHRKAHPRIPAHLLWQVVAGHLAGWGNAFVLKIRRDGRKRVTALWPLYPGRMQIVEDDGEVWYDYLAPDGRVRRLGPREVLHIRHFSLDGVVGLSPIALASQELTAISRENVFRGAMLSNGARLSGVLTTKGELSDEASARVAKQWNDAHQGEDMAGSVAVLEGGMEWLQMSAAPKDLEFVEQRKASVADVARMFNMPPSIVNAPKNDSLTYATSDGEWLTYSKLCVTPGYLRPIEGAINADPDLTPVGSGLEVEFLLDGLLRPDARTRADVYTAALNPATGWMRREEVRAAENLPAEPNPPVPPEPSSPATPTPAP